MASSEDAPSSINVEISGDEYIGADVSKGFKRLVRMRASQLDMTVAEYLRTLARDDIEQTELPKVA